MGLRGTGDLFRKKNLGGGVDREGRGSLDFSGARAVVRLARHRCARCALLCLSRHGGIGIGGMEITISASVTLWVVLLLTFLLGAELIAHRVWIFCPLESISFPELRLR